MSSICVEMNNIIYPPKHISPRISKLIANKLGITYNSQGYLTDFQFCTHQTLDIL